MQSFMHNRHILRLLLCAVLMLSLALAEAPPQAELAFPGKVIEVYVGTELDLRGMLSGIEPDESITFVSTNPSVVYINEQGLCRILSRGRSRITAQRQDGQRVSMTIIAMVAKPVRRALLLSEQLYDDGRVRTGAINTVQGVSDMLSALRYRQGTPFETTIRIDSSLAQIESTLQEAFFGAESDDLSLFYINCHGDIQDGEPVLLLHDGTGISVRRLEELLRPIRGQVLVLLDCCASGAFIGKSASELFAQEATAALSNTALLNGKYLVIVSCGADEDSYRISDTGETTEAAMSTVFARALCEGLGWDLNSDRSVSLRADANRNGIVSYTELWLYMQRRVRFHLAGTGVEQTVLACPEIDESPLFARLFS